MNQEQMAIARISGVLGDDAKKVRRNLLLASSSAIVIAHTGLLPKQIEGLGIEFSDGHQVSMVVCLAALIIFLLFSFILSASADLIMKRLGKKEAVKGALRKVIADGIAEYTGDPMKDKAKLEIKKYIEKISGQINVSNKVINCISKIQIVWEAIFPITVSLYALGALAWFWRMTLS